MKILLTIVFVPAMCGALAHLAASQSTSGSYGNSYSKESHAESLEKEAYKVYHDVQIRDVLAAKEWQKLHSNDFSIWQQYRAMP